MMASLADRQHWRLVASVAIVLAFGIASWTRLGRPFVTAEAAFVHQALVAGKHVVSPAFSGPENRIATAALGSIAQTVGYAERPLRIAFIVLVGLAAAALAEILVGFGAIAALVPTLAFLALPSVVRTESVRPELLVVLPASLALLAIPAALPIGAARACIALVGALAAGALGFAPAAVIGLVLAGSALLGGDPIDRLLTLLCGAASLAAAWVVHGSAPSLAEWTALDRSLVLDAATPAAVLLAGWIAGRTGGPGRFVAVVLLVALGAFQWFAAPAAGPTPPSATLDRLRTIAIPGTGLCAHGPDRVRVAVYARLGHPPQIPVIYLPEHATVETVAALCRDASIQELWFTPPLDAVPPGFSTPDQRRADVPGAAPLRVEAR